MAFDFNGSYLNEHDLFFYFVHLRDLLHYIWLHVWLLAIKPVDSQTDRRIWEIVDHKWLSFKMGVHDHLLTDRFRAGGISNCGFQPIALIVTFPGLSGKTLPIDAYHILYVIHRACLTACSFSLTLLLFHYNLENIRLRQSSVSWIMVFLHFSRSSGFI